MSVARAPHDASPPAPEYRGPTTVSTFEFAGRSIRLARPVEPDRLLDDPAVHAWNRTDDYMPYWAYLWPGAGMLAEAVVSRWAADDPRDEVLELGCGLGLGGLAAMALGFRVSFSDYDPAAFGFIRRSVAENGFPAERATTLLLDWREPPDARYPRIIAADVLYEKKLVPLVAGVLARMLAPGGEALLTTPYRASAEAFPQAAAAVGLVSESEPAWTLDEAGERRPGTIYRVLRRPGVTPGSIAASR
ncbi:class I SAM-dependent methyltransferase [Paludisphaera mucosa]|uniref:Methyltransferase domain-containing protein n=1 Tax=Paludisphaera mucosa TaxID=3030827 RepID=A0ABT6FHZ3_9BACT|nr:methyltransferase domain-containing protein [Paludisphaera mucosa]MDG3007157.1 methyltransferase domain-containing protein [Paludisphaera mucosa]